MKWLFAPLPMLIANSTESELAREVEFLKVENQMLRWRLKFGNRRSSASITMVPVDSPALACAHALLLTAQ